MHIQTLAAALAVALTLTLAGCGIKGPLYLPEPPSTGDKGKAGPTH